MKKTGFLAATAFFLATLWGSGAAAEEWRFVGSFLVNNGPDWNTNPPVYSGQEAAALLFGGSPADYRISTNSNTTDPATITDTAWYSTWGTSCSEQPQSYRVDDAPPGYNDPGGSGTAASAYVSDWCNGGQVNYVWSVPKPVPALSSWATIALCALLAAAGMHWFGKRRLA